MADDRVNGGQGAPSRDASRIHERHRPGQLLVVNVKNTLSGTPAGAVAPEAVPAPPAPDVEPALDVGFPSQSVCRTS